MYNEMFAEDRAVRGPYEKVAEWINAAGVDLLKLRQNEAEAIFRKIGITFAVYGEGGDPERLIPFDLIPRVFGASEWRKLSRGIKQRSRALNAFLYDVYHRGEILRAGVIPEELVYQNEAFLPDMIGVDPPGRVYSHIVGVDIVRTDGDKFQVLEDSRQLGRRQRRQEMVLLGGMYGFHSTDDRAARRPLPSIGPAELSRMAYILRSFRRVSRFAICCAAHRHGS